MTSDKYVIRARYEPKIKCKNIHRGLSFNISGANMVHPAGLIAKILAASLLVFLAGPLYWRHKQLYDSLINSSTSTGNISANNLAKLFPSPVCY